MFVQNAYLRILNYMVSETGYFRERSLFYALCLNYLALKEPFQRLSCFRKHLTKTLFSRL